MNTSVMNKKAASMSGLAIISLMALSACGSGGETPTATGEPAPETENTTPAENETSENMDPAANLVGPACESYAEDVPEGPGSVQGMALDPVATAASNNPILTTLTAAVSGELNPDVNLVDTLNSDEYTVFAPTDDAFAKIDSATIETLGTDSELLTSILTYHVIPGQMTPDEIAGTHTTVNGADVEVSMEGDEITVNGETMVICGGVQTANATVYLVDTVLMPPATGETAPGAPTETESTETEMESETQG